MRLWDRLAFRFGLGLAAAGLLTLLGSAWFNVHLQNDHMLGLMQSRADQLVGVVMSVTHDAMLANDNAELEHLINAIGQQEDIRRIRLISRDGVVAYSTDPTDAGRVIEPTSPSCVSCHQHTPPVAEVPPTGSVRVLDLPGEPAGVLEVVAAVSNQARCSSAACHAHPPEHRVLGVLEARVSLAAAQTDLASSSRELALGLFLGAAVIVVVVGFLTWRWVLRPIGDLTFATDRLASGDQGARVPVHTHDEIGVLGNAWNHMADELMSARADLEDWSATLEQRVEDKTAELQQAQDQMLRVERMASLGALAAEVAHEINNPLAGIAMYARLMRRKLGTDGSSEGGPGSGEIDRAELANVLEMIDEEGRRCGRIVRNLLLFSRTPTARISDVDVGAVVQRCCMLIGHKAQLETITIDSEVDPGTPVIQGDAAQIEQMLLGLVMNAIEACDPEDTVTIVIEPGKLEDGVRAVVRDTGRGIPAEYRDKIFEPFFSTKTESSGIGLGLSVVYGIVHRHGGTIEVRSQEGVGTEMIVELPGRPPGELDEEPTGSGEVFKRFEPTTRPPDREQEP
jgi:two-component system NtrC family sensor kinase